MEIFSESIEKLGNAPSPSGAGALSRARGRFSAHSQAARDAAYHQVRRHLQRAYPYPFVILGGGLNVIRKDTWLFCRTSSGVRLCWQLEEPKGPEGVVLGMCRTPVGSVRLRRGV